MNEETKQLEARVKPLVAEVAKSQSIDFEPKSSSVLRQYHEHDETARFIFDSFITTSTSYQNCGGFVLTNPEQLEQYYAESSSRRNELIDNKIFVFALDGDGSFFAFGLETRKFYHFDFSPWVDDEAKWNECLSEESDTNGFCDFFEEEFAANS